MSDTTFSSGTVISSAWLNDVNAATYKANTSISPSTGITTLTAAARNALTVNIQDFGVIGDGVTDNTTSLAKVVTFVTNFSGNANPPVIVVPAGIYAFSTSPNWAVYGMKLFCAPGVIFKHTGSGIAMDFDGGASTTSVIEVELRGKPMIQGNINTTYAVRTRAVHHSIFEFQVRDVTSASLLTQWAVCNEYRVECSPVNRPAFSPTPVNGLVLDHRGAGENTSACIFYNTIMEGLIAGYGINLVNAVQNTFIGGTSEANAGGVTISASSGGNTFINLDMELNTTADIFCQGPRNQFINCLSTTTSTFFGEENKVSGGVFNSINNTGTRNWYELVTYNSAGTGTFVDSGTAIRKHDVYNITTASLDSDQTINPQKLYYTAGASSSQMVRGSADQLVGGATTDTVDYKFGNNQYQIWINNFKNLSLGNGSMGFFGTAPITKPTISGAKAGNVALTNLLTQLAALGLITDSTT